MNISHRHTYLYFVIPKCASATLRMSLKPYTDVGYPVSVFEQHLTMLEFMKTEFSSFLDPYFKFTFVLNPYDRLYSGFRQDLSASLNQAAWKKVKAPIFEEIGEDFNRYLLEFAAKADVLRAWDWICFTPMREFAVLEGQYRLDWFGKMETFQSDLMELSRRLGVDVIKAKDQNFDAPPQAGLKYLGKYSRAAIEWVNETYADDFELFGYEKVDPADFPVTLPA